MRKTPRNHYPLNYGGGGPQGWNLGDDVMLEAADPDVQITWIEHPHSGRGDVLPGRG